MMHISFVSSSLLLYILHLKICRVETSYCPEAIDSIKNVESCPSSKQEWDSAANKKNCSEQAVLQGCSPAERFIYHCVVNGNRNEMLEVCAPQINISGHCAEFNVTMGAIQSAKTPCKKDFPKCDKFYRSSDAYKYPDCFPKIALPTNETTESSQTENGSNLLLTAVLIGISILQAGVIIFLIWRRYGYKKRRKRQASKKSEKSSTFLKNHYDTEQGTRYIRRQKDTSDNVGDVSFLITTEAEETRQDLKHNADHTNAAKECGEVYISMSRTVRDIRTQLEKHQSSSDKYAFGFSKTNEDFCEENKEESRRFLNYYKRMDQYFVETEAYREAEKVFNKNNIVILTGQSGCGKTFSSTHLILKHMEETTTFRKIHSWEELLYLNEDANALVLVDNISLMSHLDKWRNAFQRIHDEYFADNALKLNRLSIVMTARSNAIERACINMKNIPSIFNKKHMINADQLSDLDKDDILSKQIEFAKAENNHEVPNINAEFRKKVKKSKGPLGFPFCAHLYVFSKEYQKSEAMFFSKPIEHLKLQIQDEIESDKSLRVKSLFFYVLFCEWNKRTDRKGKKGNDLSLEKCALQNENYCTQFLDKISTDLLKHFDPFNFTDLETEAERLSGVFFKEVDEHTYTFFHDTLYDAVLAYFCATYLIKTVRYFPLDIIRNQDFGELTDKQASTFALRLLYDALSQKCSNVFALRMFQNAKFSDRFCLEIQKKETATVKKMFTEDNKSSFVKLPCMFWSSYYELAYLTERFYDIVKENNINPCYQLYVSLLGLCCARSKRLLENINELNDYKLIREHVMQFKDDEGNSILHVIIASENSDGFAAIAVDKLIKDGMSVELKNNQRLTPLMYAQEHKTSRMSVIKRLTDVINFE